MTNSLFYGLIICLSLTSTFLEPVQNLREILQNVIITHGVSNSKKTAYLNSFVKLIKVVGYDTQLGLPMTDILSW